MKTKKLLLNYFSFVLFFYTGGWHITAQNSEIIGLVKDKLGVLPDASIVVKGTSNGTNSNFDGHFNLINIALGQHTLVISYIGYKTQEIKVVTKKNEVLNIGTILLSGSNELDQIVIQGNNLPNQQKALNIKKNAIAIMEVLASDAIGKLPDRNAAEAVQRVSGVSIERDHGEGRYVIVRGAPIAWNSTLMNGERMPSTEGTSDNTGGTRSTPLDIFPSEMIKYVQLSKAITPDMEGDAIGGSVNFITKTAPSKKTLNVNLGYGYNNQAKKPIQSGSFVYGDRVANQKIGFLVSGTYWNRNWGTDNYELVYNQENHAIKNLQLRDYLGTRTTTGLNTAMEYKPNSNNTLYFRSLYTNFKDRESALEHIFNFDKGNMDLRVREGIIDIIMHGMEFGGEHRFNNGRFNLDWKLSTYTAEMGGKKVKGSKANTNAYLITTFSTPVTYNNLSSDGYKFLDIDSPKGYSGDPYTNVQPYLSTPVTADQLLLNNKIAYPAFSLETDYTAKLDLTYKTNNKLTFKVGAKFKRKNIERGSAITFSSYLGNDKGAPIAINDFKTRPFPYRGGYLSEIGNPYNGVLVQNTIRLDQIDDLFTDETDANPLFLNVKLDQNNPSSAGSFYSGYEHITAAYLMGDYYLTNKLKLIGGVRYEHTNLVYKGNSVITDENKDTTIKKVRNNNNFGSLLPMLNLKYQAQYNLNIKFAYTRTMARANFSELNPTQTTNFLTTPNTINRGNIKLKPTYSNNFDLIAEYFFDNIGILSGGAFYKSLENVIFTGKSFQTIDGNLFQVTQPQNSEAGWLAGFEVGLSKRLTFLPSFLSGLGVEANYTFADSEIEVPTYSTNALTAELTVTKTTEKIPNQSKHIFNASIFYEKGPLTFRLAGNYKDASLTLVQGNPENYRWYGKNLTVDFTASANLTKKIKIYLELNNLTNEPLRYYQGVPERPEQTEYYSIRGLLGVNYKIF
ncbi:MAG: TonB-dependent receptor [Tenacibaculum sp.]